MFLCKTKRNLTKFSWLLGFSYGTTLGATVASMFPDRVDKFVIDGVQNPHEYYHALAYVFTCTIYRFRKLIFRLDRDFEEWSDSDRVFSEIFLSCARAGPLKCPMAASNLTGEQMEATAWKIAEDLKTNPIRVDNETVYDYTIIRSLYALALYGPENWPVVATLLSYVATNQTSDPVFVRTSKALYDALIASAVTFAPLYGIHCSDRIPRLDTLDEFRPVQDRLSSISKVMDGGSTALSMACAQWKTDAKERYLGDFQVNTKNPILIATNMYDGHTPIRSARNVSSGFEGSGMLVVNGFGVSSIFIFYHDGTFFVLMMLFSTLRWHSRRLATFDRQRRTGTTEPCRLTILFARLMLNLIATILGRMPSRQYTVTNWAILAEMAARRNLRLPRLEPMGLSAGVQMA